MNAAVNNMRVTHTSTFTLRGEPEAGTQYSFYLGKNGPFSLTYSGNEDTADRVNADIEILVQKLVAVGALPAGT